MELSQPSGPKKQRGDATLWRSCEATLKAKEPPTRKMSTNRTRAPFLVILMLARYPADALEASTPMLDSTAFPGGTAFALSSVSHCCYDGRYP